MKPAPQIYSLALYPQTEEFSILDIENLTAYLLDIGLLGEVFQCNAEQRYRLGERFYQLLSFMGCAPALKLEPDSPADVKFCHIRFTKSPQSEFYCLRPDVKARCPHCHKAGSTAQQIRQSCFTGRQDWVCPHCRTAIKAEAINWKHEAGISSFLIELIDVHPHEVVPTDSFLKGLATLTGHHWQYFYNVNG